MMREEWCLRWRNGHVLESLIQIVLRLGGSKTERIRSLSLLIGIVAHNLVMRLSKRSGRL